MPVDRFQSLILLVLVLAAIAMPAKAAVRMSGPVVICEDLGEAAPPTFSGPDCTKLGSIALVDPQNRSLWVRGRVMISSGDTPERRPLGIFIAAKASSEVWVNGVYLGANGHPSVSRHDEIAGRLDAVFYLPRSALNIGENEIVIRLSSHHGFIKLRYPINGVFAGAYRSPTAAVLSAYVPAAFTLGIFLIGAFYFGGSAVWMQDRARPALLSLLCVLASAQLFAEIARGLFNYTYPIQDLRLLAILVLAGAFGLSLSAYIFLRFARKIVLPGMFIISILMIIGAFLAPGFDAKSIIAILIPTVAALILCIWRILPIKQNQRHRGAALKTAAGLGAFIALIVLRTDRFLDIYFFIAIAGLIAFLFYQEIKNFADERIERQAAAKRALKLEEALEQTTRQASQQRITLKDSGTSIFVEADDIIACSGAGDYVEVRLRGDKHILHLGTLGDLENALNGKFLRIHRSHLVNSDHIRSLVREDSGSGRLELSEGDALPVSRRIMPRVRETLLKENVG